MIARVLLVIFGLISPLCAMSVRLQNDSVYPLTAEIYTSQGDLLVTIKLKPSQSYIWEKKQSNYETPYNFPYTPLFVRWVCSDSQPYNYEPIRGNKKQQQKEKENHYDSVYGTWPIVQPGSTVLASRCENGSKTCVMEKRPRKLGKQDRSIPNIDQQTDGYNRFSNDGGQTWTNDGGSVVEP